ncbi:MAG: tRNA (N(6)-L-threonylcarbamoyladenosine(37)-C(2))-methylthiotransferase MtaB [Erysipelotrichales bacterium]|nr:tRNA (N(6)-L-threonylcarbamoyladenosine(37)-C(2))-methylthiotransferase MtaB [Erysipelotrichales bacterium]
MKKFKIHTLGCKVNTYESQAMSYSLKEAGYVEVGAKEPADVYIIHTCVVTNTAAFKSRQKFAQARKENPNAVIVGVGCYIQTNIDAAEGNENIDILIGSDGKSKIVEVLDEYYKKHAKLNCVTNISDVKLIEDFEAYVFEHQCRAFLKIQDGCNQFCSYCIIPYSRGRERSLPMERVVSMANHLVERGHHEIVLTGIHTGRYGRDLGYTLNDLLIELCKIEGLHRIRLSSIEVIEITDELLETMHNNPKIANHLHIPLQAGDNETLKQMHRPYTCEDYKNRITEIRRYFPEISISSDIIVGFPSESDEQYELSKRFIEECELSFLHVFPFSARIGTPAASMKNVFHGTAKKERAKDLGEVSNKLKSNYYKKFEGKVIDVMVESTHDGKYYGYSSEYIWTEITADCIEVGTIVPVYIKEANDDICFGEVVR